MFRTVSLVTSSAKGRGFSTASAGGYTYQTSQLKNGLRVVSASSPSAPLASLGLYINGGSRIETPQTLGSSGVFRRLAFKGNDNFSELRLTREFDSVPATYEVAVGREQFLFHTEFPQDKLALVLQLLQQGSSPAAREHTIRHGREDVEMDTQLSESDPRSFILDVLHREAYRSSGLGRSTVSPSHRIHHVGPKEVESFLSAFSGKGATLVATGNLTHEEVVRDAEGAFAERHWGQPAKPQGDSKYQGGEFKLATDSHETYIGLAFEGAASGSADEHASTLLRIILGGGKKERDYGIGQGHTSRLYKNVIQKGQNIKSVESFNLNYSDSGLFGLIAATSGKSKDATNELTSALATLSKSPVTEEELNKAKEAFKTETLFKTETRSGLSEFLAVQTGTVKSPAEFVSAVDKVKVEDINKFTKKVFGSQPTLAVVGEDLDGVASPHAIHQMLQ